MNRMTLETVDLILKHTWNVAVDLAEPPRKELDFQLDLQLDHQ